MGIRQPSTVDSWPMRPMLPQQPTCNAAGSYSAGWRRSRGCRRVRTRIRTRSLPSPARDLRACQSNRNGCGTDAQSRWLPRSRRPPVSTGSRLHRASVAACDYRFPAGGPGLSVELVVVACSRLRRAGCYRFRFTGARPATALAALATCSSIPRSVRRARSALCWWYTTWSRRLENGPAGQGWVSTCPSGISSAGCSRCHCTTT